jgi:predicted nuclease of predicted toxin-antitoxin system
MSRICGASRGPSRNPADQVKFLVDANLPPRLCVWLRSQRHEAEHLFDRNLLTVTDTQIWERGRLESLVIFSKDTDFYDRALLYGAPPPGRSPVRG